MDNEEDSESDERSVEKDCDVNVGVEFNVLKTVTSVDDRRVIAVGGGGEAWRRHKGWDMVIFLQEEDMGNKIYGIEGGGLCEVCGVQMCEIER